MFSVEHLQEEVSRVIISRETSIFDDESKEAITSMIEKPRRNRSFDEYCFSKHDFRRSNWPKSFRTKMIRCFEHPAFQILYKEI